MPFVWGKRQDCAYRAIKTAICNSDLLTCFTGKSKLVVEVDASPNGVGAVLLQIEDGIERPLMFSSKKLTAAEMNYSQTDREALAIVFSLNKFRYYLLGRNFILRTDHKPLLGLFGKEKKIPENANARLTRWSIFLSQFQYDLVHKSGKANCVADALSRLPIQDEFSHNVPTEYVKMIELVENYNLSFKDIQDLTKKDIILSRVLGYVKYGWPCNDNMCFEYAKVKNDLSIHNNVVLFRNRLVIPSAIRPRILDLVHSGHNGMVAMKAESRENLWWPNISQDIEEKAKSCGQCVERNNQPTQPKLKWADPGKPWYRIHIDYCDFEGKDFLVMVDAHSKFIDVHATTITTSKATIECLRRSFANFGIPHEIVSDNAPNLVSSDIKAFYAKNNIVRKNSAPYHPASNGLAERAVQTFKKGLRKFKSGSINTRISRFLYNYRRTECSVTKKSPDSVMFNRKFRSPLDISVQENSRREEETGDKEISRFVIGQGVYAKNFGKGEKWLPGIIEKVQGVRNYVVKVFGGHGNMIWRRHADQLKSRFNEIVESDQSGILDKNLIDRGEAPEIIPTSEPSSEVWPELLGSRSPTTETLVSGPVVAPPNQQPENVQASTRPEGIAPSPRVETTTLREKSLPSGRVTTRSGRAVKPPIRYSD